MIETYLTERKQLKGVISIVDVRHPPTNDDVMMYEFLKYYKIPSIIIATKADKIPRGKWQKHLKIVKDTLKVQKGDQVILFSSETGEGKEEAWHAITSLLFDHKHHEINE